MATITSLGVGSGLDLTGMLEDLEEIENQQLDIIQDKIDTYEAKTGGYDTLLSALETFSEATEALTDADLYTSKEASDNTAFSTEVTSDAETGSYTIYVSQLATAQSLVSGTTVSDTSTAQSDADSTLTITVGDTTTEISLTADQTSLSGLVDAINSASAGVTASVIQSGDSSYQLVVTSDDTGSSSTITISSDDTTLSSLIGYDSTSDSNGMSEAVAAQDAILTVNGITVTRSSNTIENVPAEGVTMTLSSVSTESETLIVSKSITDITSAIEDWVDAYNTLLETFDSLTTYTAVESGEDQDEDNGVLIGDSVLRGIKNKLKSLLSSAQDSDTYQGIAQLGITLESDGTLELDSETLINALTEDASAVSDFFVGDGSSTGLATQMVSTIETYIEDDGIIANAIDGIDDIITKLETKYDKVQAHIESVMARYEEQFTALDVLISELDTTSTYLENAFDELSSSD